jgi:hypothetical protein
MKNIFFDKYFNIVEWVAVIILMALFASDMIYLPASNDQNATLYTSFSMPKPVIYRVLVPLLARFMMEFGARPDLAIAFILFLSGLGAFYMIRKLFVFYGMEWLALFSFMLTYILVTSNHSTPLDFMTVFLFLLAYYLMATGNHLAYCYLFPLIVLHRETSVLLIGLYALYRWIEISHEAPSLDVFYEKLQYGDALLSQLIIYIFFKTSLVMAFPEAQGSAIHFLIHDPMGVYLQTPAMLSALFIIIGILLIVRSRWALYPPFLKAAFVLFPVQIGLHLLAGNPFEFRVMAESFPIVLLMVFMGMTYKKPSNAPNIVIAKTDDNQLLVTTNFSSENPTWMRFNRLGWIVDIYSIISNAIRALKKFSKSIRTNADQNT